MSDLLADSLGTGGLDERCVFVVVEVGVGVGVAGWCVVFVFVIVLAESRAGNVAGDDPRLGVVLLSVRISIYLLGGSGGRTAVWCFVSFAMRISDLSDGLERTS